jgi:hypothetical protein
MNPARVAVLLAVLALTPVSAQAQDPDAFARQWTVLGPCASGADIPGGAARAAPVARPDADSPLGCEGAFMLVLDDAVYRHVVDTGLGDLAAFNADDEALAFGPMPQAFRAPPPDWVPRPWFALPATPAGPPGDLHLHVQRDTDGNLSLDATLRHGGESAVRDLLVDVRAGKRLVEAIEFELAFDAADFSSTLAVDASDDLQSWRTIVPAATVAQLRQQGQALVRRRIEFPAVSARYLRLHVVGGAPVPLRALRLQLPSDQPLPEAFGWDSARAEFLRRDGRAFVYRAPGRMPVARANVLLSNDNALASFAIAHREPGARDWTYAGQLEAFRLRGAGLRLDNEPIELPRTRAGEWRVEPRTELREAPVLELSWRPEPWLLLTHGKPPYRVVAGSAVARRQDAPLDVLVGEVRRRYGAGWEPAPVTLGALRDAGGDAALSAWDPAKRRTWLLWGVLLLASAAIIAMVLRLLRQPNR